MNIESGESEPAFPGIGMVDYDVSPDGKWVVYSTAGSDEKPHSLWLTPTDRSSPPKEIAHSGESTAHFGPDNQILFRMTEGNFTYLEQMNPNGAARSKAIPYPIGYIHGISPGRRWMTLDVPFPDGTGAKIVVVPPSCPATTPTISRTLIPPCTAICIEFRSRD